MKPKTKTFEKLKDQTFVLNLIIPQSQIQSSYQSVLVSYQSKLKIDGFRSGKIPLDLVKDKVSATTLLEETASGAISKVYSEKIKEFDLKPIIQPKIKLKNPPISLDKEWEVEVTGCETPQITLSPSYLDDIKKINQSKDNSKDLVSKYYQTLLKHSQVDLPAILIEANLSQEFSRLIDQTSQAGISVDDYFKSKNTTQKAYQDALSKKLKEDWTINLAISDIAKTQKIQIESREVEALLAKNPGISQNINLVYYLLEQQKVLDYLKTLK
jgi:FKBP-type peptidyl-prolyl cis-trans isomerase (trigger factor)